MSSNKAVGPAGAPGPSDSNDELALIDRCRAGEESACRTLYLRHAPEMHRLARRLGAPPGELDDVIQEVFLRAFRHLQRFQTGELRHWLARLCANVVTDHHRRRRVRDGFGGSARQAPWEAAEVSLVGGSTPESLAVRGQAERQVAEILARMRPKLREVFALFELEQLSGEEIALRLGCPAATVRTRLFHARRAFVRIGLRRGFVNTGGNR